MLERSAEQANFYEVGRDRLVKPTIRQGDTPVEEDKSPPGGGGNGGGGGDDFAGLDPLVAGLLRRMPKAGEKWPVVERARWLQTLAMNLSFIHADEADGPAISVTVLPGTAKHQTHGFGDGSP